MCVCVCESGCVDVSTEEGLYGRERKKLLLCCLCTLEEK